MTSFDSTELNDQILGIEYLPYLDVNGSRDGVSCVEAEDVVVQVQIDGAVFVNV